MQTQPGPEPTSVAPPSGNGTPGAGRGVSAALAVVTLAAVVGAVVFRNTRVTPSHYLLLSLLLFTAGSIGVLVRRNALVLFMCIELMLNAANIAFVTFARMHGRVEGQAIVLFVMVVAAAEVAVGLAIIVSIHRRGLSSNVDDVSELRW